MRRNTVRSGTIIQVKQKNESVPVTTNIHLVRPLRTNQLNDLRGWDGIHGTVNLIMTDVWYEARDKITKRLPP